MILCYWLPSFIIYHETRINYINIITTKCDNRVFKDVLLINRMKNEGKVKKKNTNNKASKEKSSINKKFKLGIIFIR